MLPYSPCKKKKQKKTDGSFANGSRSENGDTPFSFVKRIDALKQTRGVIGVFQGVHTQTREYAAEGTGGMLRSAVPSEKPMCRV